MLSWHDIRLLYLRELRSALRERSIIFGSILLPLLMYPALLWLMFSGIGFVQGQTERFVSRVAIDSADPAAQALTAQLADDDRFDLVDMPAGERDEALRAGSVDLVVEILPADAEAVGLAGNYTLSLAWDSSKDRSDKARSRLDEVLEDHRYDWLRTAAERRGVDAAEWQVLEVERDNIASDEDIGAAILGLIVPLLMIIMIAVGCFYPAVDSTAGERERSTWETLMVSGPSRASVLIAKYLYVATMGGVAGMLNLIAMAVSMRAVLAPLLADDELGLSFEIPLAALPLLALSALMLAMFVAAGMMLFAVFARTFKEGQSMVTPVYLLSMLPPMLVMAPDLELTTGWALVPVSNVTLLFRQAIVGDYNWLLIGLTLLVQAAAISLLLLLARWILSFEDVVVGSYSGSLSKFLQERFKR